MGTNKPRKLQTPQTPLTDEERATVVQCVEFCARKGKQRDPDYQMLALADKIRRGAR